MFYTVKCEITLLFKNWGSHYYFLDIMCQRSTLTDKNRNIAQMVTLSPVISLMDSH